MHKKVATEARVPNYCRYSFVDGPFLEIVGSEAAVYEVEFIDKASGRVVHNGTIENNCWIRAACQYFTPWQINVFTPGRMQLVFTHDFDCRGKKVMISFESRALGDTLAWLPAANRFRKQHGCELICSTHHNELFRARYPNIRFVKPGADVKHLYARYSVGWFYDAHGNVDLHRNVSDFRLQPLGAAACDILGIEFIEERPELAPANAGKRPFPDEYVCIGVHASAQAKYWNNPQGWPDLVTYLRLKGYRVVLLSSEGREHMGNVAPEDAQVLPRGPLSVVLNYLRHARLFIGVGSGLSWLAWAAGTRTCIISGFSLPYSEPADCIRIQPPAGHCHGCFNRHRLDASDWNWCPDHAQSPRMFECTRSITSAEVIAAIEPYV